MTVRAEPIADRYELVEEINSGGMGQVWRGYDLSLVTASRRDGA